MNQNSYYILKERYLWTDPETKEQETPEQLFQRVAETMAGVEATPELQNEYTDKFYRILMGLRFLPNTPALINAGRPLGQLAACFVLPVGDSIEEIFDAVKYGAIIHKSGGGTGYSFSRLRENGCTVQSTSRIASGPVGFMYAFDAATETIKQGGVRRGANMGMLRVDHPDIMQFITAKSQPGMYTNFNLSVALTDKFMEALEQDEFYELISPKDGRTVRQMKASEVMAAIVEGAWTNGEPGVVFIDTINRQNPVPALGEVEATNPCGEQPLMPYESCVLGSINLGIHVKDGQVNMERLEETTRLAVRFLDNAIDASASPLPQIDEATKANRKIGLGIMGWADMLLWLGIEYNSQPALDLVDEVMGQIYQWADEESRKLAVEKGPFPNAHIADEMAKGRRNATVTTIAPTGTISIIAGASSGIEPLFGYSQASKRKIVTDILFEMADPVKVWCEKNNIDLSNFNPSKTDINQATQEVERLNTYLKGILPKYFVTAHDVSPEWHLKMQAVFQRYIENAVSKTINMPKSATKKDVEQAYLTGYRIGLKGLTIYRDGSRDEQVIYTSVAKKLSVVRQRPDELDGKVYKTKTEKGKTAYLTVAKDERGEPFEVFANSLEGMERPWDITAIFRLVSLSLRAGVSVAEVCRQLEKANEVGGNMFTTPAQIKRVLLKAAGADMDEGVCLHCGGVVTRRGGCLECPCGKSNKCD